MDNKRFKKRRIEMGLTQDDIAKIIGVQPSTIGMYEQGKRQPDNEKLTKIANVLETTTDYLLGLVDIPNKVNTKYTTIKLTDDEIKIITVAESTGLTSDEFVDLIKNISPYLKKKKDNN